MLVRRAFDPWKSAAQAMSDFATCFSSSIAQAIASTSSCISSSG